MKAWLVVPAWKRYNISEIVFSELKWLKYKVSKNFNLEVVVIADDKNLILAKKYGFKTVNRNNDYLGRKFNDGYEYAFSHGADVAIPSGSDSFVHPDIFKNKDMINWDKTDTIYYSTMHSMINEDGSKLGVAQIPNQKGLYNKGALWFYPKSLMKNCKFRPCEDNKKSSCDRSTISGILKNNKNVNFKVQNYNELQYLALKNNKIQIWGYNLYKDKFIKEYDNIFPHVDKFYGQKFSKKIKGLYR